MVERSELSEGDLFAVESFENFLSWRIKPGMPPRPIPPVVWAYMFGATQYCPPVGTW